MFRAFSDPVRLRILRLLVGGELCVGDLTAVVHVPAAERLAAFGLFEEGGPRAQCRKAGLWSYYSLAPADGEFHESLLDCLARCFDEVPDMRADANRAPELKAGGGCCPEESCESANGRPAKKPSSKHR